MRTDLWSPDRDALLARLWSEGMTAAKIAEAIGMPSKNSIVGRAHRLKLPKRPSPIRRDKLKLTPRRPRAPVAKPAPAGPILSETAACQWIESEPSRDDACKCGAPAIVGKPYCPSHQARAYIKPDSAKYKRELRTINFIGGRKAIGVDTAHLILAA